MAINLHRNQKKTDMMKNQKPIEASTILLPNLICEMLSLCTSEDRRDLFEGLLRVSRRESIGAIFNALYRGSEPTDNKRAAARITSALSIPACIVINKILAKYARR